MDTLRGDATWQSRPIMNSFARGSAYENPAATTGGDYKSGLTGPHALQTTVVAALIHVKCDRPTATYNELKAVASTQLVQLVYDADNMKKLGVELKKLCIKKKVSFTRAHHDRTMAQRGAGSWPGAARGGGPPPASPAARLPGAASVFLAPSDWDDLVADALGPELHLAVSLQASLCAARSLEQRLVFAAIDRIRRKPTKKDYSAAAAATTMGGSSAAL